VPGMEGLNSKCTQSFFSSFLGPHIGPNKVTSLEWGQWFANQI
jgi:hypothetical protein